MKTNPYPVRAGTAASVPTKVNRNIWYGPISPMSSYMFSCLKDFISKKAKNGQNKIYNLNISVRK